MAISFLLKIRELGLRAASGWKKEDLRNLDPEWKVLKVLLSLGGGRISSSDASGVAKRRVAKTSGGIIQKEPPSFVFAWTGGKKGNSLDLKKSFNWAVLGTCWGLKSFDLKMSIKAEKVESEISSASMKRQIKSMAKVLVGKGYGSSFSCTWNVSIKGGIMVVQY